MNRAASVIIGIIAIATSAHAYSWSAWERKNLVVQRGDFLVIKQPGESFCYLKQSHNDDPSKMELAMKADGLPYLTVPFIRGIEGTVVIRIDDGEVESIRVPRGGAIMLSETLVPGLKAGSWLYVTVQPVGRQHVTQRFSLKGFTAAAALLESARCTS